jgi:hypothetical protein
MIAKSQSHRHKQKTLELCHGVVANKQFSAFEARLDLVTSPPNQIDAAEALHPAAHITIKS